MVNKTKCREAYPTDLTDKQWAEIAPLFAGMHKQKWDKRELVNAVFYLVKTGCQWRNLPNDFPPHQTVYSFFGSITNSMGFRIPDILRAACINEL